MHRKLPETRMGLVHKFTVGGVKGYLRTGLQEDGSLGEVFINLNKSQDAGPYGCLGTMISMALQRDVSLRDICKKLMYTQFEPRGATKNPEIPMATSIPDYIAKWLWMKFGKGEEL